MARHNYRSVTSRAQEKLFQGPDLDALNIKRAFHLQTERDSFRFGEILASNG